MYQDRAAEMKRLKDRGCLIDLVLGGLWVIALIAIVLLIIYSGHGWG